MEENKAVVHETEDNENKEVEDTEKTEKQNELPNPDQNEKKPMNIKLVMLVLAGIAVIFMMLIRGVNTGNNEDSCEVIPQSPWGQSQGPVWVETKTPAETRAITRFEMEMPETIGEYTTRTFRAYTQQIYEVRYLDDEGDVGVIIDKAYICGKGIYEYVYNDNTDYNSINKVEYNGLTVTLKGDGEKVMVAEWVDGEYSYAIASWSTPLTVEEMQDLISQVK